MLLDPRMHLCSPSLFFAYGFQRVAPYVACTRSFEPGVDFIDCVNRQADTQPQYNEADAPRYRTGTEVQQIDQDKEKRTEYAAEKAAQCTDPNHFFALVSYADG